MRRSGSRPAVASRARSPLNASTRCSIVARSAAVRPPSRRNTATIGACSPTAGAWSPRAPWSTRRRRAGTTSTRSSRRLELAGQLRAERRRTMATSQTASTIHLARRPAGKVEQCDSCALRQAYGVQQGREITRLGHRLPGRRSARRRRRRPARRRRSRPSSSGRRRRSAGAAGEHDAGPEAARAAAPRAARGRRRRARPRASGARWKPAPAAGGRTPPGGARRPRRAGAGPPAACSS